MIKSKICGISDIDILKYIISHKYQPCFIGFICNYKKSKRFVNFEKLKKLTSIKKGKVSYVAVLVKPSDSFLDKIKDLTFNYYQLYNVTPKQTKRIKDKYNKKIITSLTIKNKNDVEKYKNYIGISDIFNFDGSGYEKSIGFDHSLLKDLPNSINKMIAGNFKPEDNFGAYKSQFSFIDISGGVESENGIKDKEKINQFLININKTNDEN
jgi:phosphoribosylanthranilate isomerase